MRATAVLIIGFVLCGGCGDDTTASTDGTAERSTATVAVDPDLLAIHPVLREVAPPCAAVTAGAGELVVADPSDGEPLACLVLGPAALDATSVSGAELLAGASTDRLDVALEFDADGSRRLDDLARAQLGRRVAVLLQGRLVSAPTIEAPELSGGVALSDLTRDEAVGLVTAVGGDPTVPEPDPGLADGERAVAVCESFLPSAGEGAELGLSMPTSAGAITAGPGAVDAEPWRSLPADHFVAGCSYLLPTVGAPPTTICRDGEAYSLEQPVQVYVDEEGRSTPDPAAEVGGTAGPPTC